MKLLFLGTRGVIEKKTRRHHRHSSLLVSEGDTRLVIDCGADWLGRVAQSKPDAILLTHAYRDHVYGLSQGAPCPVYATRETWQRISRYPIADCHIIEERKLIEIGRFRAEAFAVDHSLRAPAVGYRMTMAGSPSSTSPTLLHFETSALPCKGSISISAMALASADRSGY